MGFLKVDYGSKGLVSAVSLKKSNPKLENNILLLVYQN